MDKEEFYVIVVIHINGKEEFISRDPNYLYGTIENSREFESLQHAREFLRGLKVFFSGEVFRIDKCKSHSGLAV